ncbi:cytochrome b [Stakelama saccharophila]|uniref:Cytochrome b n=1 Tax=Stakelama saccharophila TaxID=3075605 RepID=A0ABZ0B7C3_9SPHN|nr:cytochrome b [Stakelama sp. W311]WNO53194.1 cytochrome b [Stakelama sp. W311]
MGRATVRRDRYSRGAIFFHWTIALMVLFNLVVGIFHESLLEGLGLMPIHFAVGITVLVLSIGRWIWRLNHPAPRLPPGVPLAERAMAKTVQAIFYALIILMPLSGWMMMSGGPKPHAVSWFGLFDLPILPVGKTMGGASHEFHEIFGYAMAALVALHIAGALRHHFLLRDSVLRRMLGGSGLRV